MRRFVLVAMVLAVLAAAGLVLVIALSPPGQAPTAGSEDDSALGRTRRRHSEPEKPSSSAEPVAAPVVVAEPEATQPVELPLGAGRLRGVVIDAVDRTPIVGGVARLRHPTGERIAETLTDRAGEYGFEAMPDRVPLVLELEAPGYLSGLCCDVKLAAAQLLRKDVQMVRPPTLSLSVTEQGSRAPAVQALVRLSLNGAPVGRTVTDEHGRVRLALPAFGEFLLHLGGGEYADRPGEMLRVLPGSGDLELARQVLPGATLRVRVFEPSGDAAGKANVTVSAEGLPLRTGIADLSGEALFQGLATKTDYEVVAGYDDENRPALRGSALARVLTGRERVVDVRLRPSGRLTGRVTKADGTGIAGAKVTVFLPGGTRATTIRTDEDGRFDATRLPNTKVRLEIRAPGYAKTESRAHATPWEPGDVPTSQVVLAPLPPAVVTGIVTDTTGAVLRAVVRAIPANLRAATDAEGRYRLELPAGIEEQRIVASAPDHHFPEDAPRRTRAVQAVSRSSWGVDLVLERDVVDEEVADAEVATRGDDLATTVEDRTDAAVVGRVIERDSAPVPRARVSCGGVFADTDADGRFRLPSVPFVDAEERILPRLGIAPPPGLLMPKGVLLAPLAAGERRADAGEIRLAARAIAILDLTQALGAATPDAPPRALTLAYSHADEFAGTHTPPLTPLHAVSYDGTWMHLPPAYIWQARGHGRVWVLVPTSRGATTSDTSWRLRPDAVDTLRLSGDDALVAVRVKVPKTYVAGSVTFRMKGTSERGATSGDPFRSMMTARAFTETVRGRTMDVPDVPRGVWALELAPPAGVKLPVLRAALDTEAAEGRPKVAFKDR